MTFKRDWEKTQQRIRVSSTCIEKILAEFLPDQRLVSYHIISGGCANLNIKVNLEEKTLILRIYVRDQGAAYREQKLAALLKGVIPIPQVYFIGEKDVYRFAFIEYKEGSTLRDVLLNNNLSGKDLESLMQEVGFVLAKLQTYQFSFSGCLDKDLHVLPISQSYLSFANQCLRHPFALAWISKDNRSKIRLCFEKYHSFLPDESQSQLVHGDYDPANVLVKLIDGKLTLSAILDWEFAFSGSPLWDVANMLRYAHHMPLAFKDSFIQGLTQGGMQLQEGWQISIDLLTLSSLLDCLTRCSPSQCPNQGKDIQQLIDYILKKLN